MDGKTPLICKRCGETMEQVTEIAPLHGSAGLLVLMCPSCGAADSVLVNPKRKSH
jgi:RNA polymerase subunit RPABC4/transcription elongation factor Spt4